MKKIISTLLLLAMIIVVFSSVIIQISAAVTPVSSIFPSGIYYIRNQRSGMYMDVEYLATADNSPVKQGYYNGGENQRFQVNYINSGIYEIIPMHAQNMRIDICNGSTDENAPVNIFTSNSSNAQRFKILSTGNGDDSFKIMTQVSDFTKCITIAGSSMGVAARVVQNSYENNGNEDSDHWYFEEITLNEKNLVTLTAGQTKTFEFTVPDNMYYVVETMQKGSEEHDTYLTVGNLSTGTQYNDDGGLSLYSLIGFNNQGGRNITISVRFYDPEEAGSFWLQIRKQRAVYYGFDYGAGDANSLPALTAPYSSFLNMYNSFKYENKDASHFIELDERGFSRYNSEIVFFNGHGGNGKIYFNNQETSMNINQITDMNSVRLVVWAACYSACEENSYETSFVYKSIDEGAGVAIGFPDTITDISSRSFADDLFEKLATGYTIADAAEYAADQLIWPFDNVKDYVVAGASFNVLATPIHTKSLPVNPSQNNLISNYNNLLTREYVVYNNGDVDRYYLTINGIITNQFVDIPKNTSVQNYTTQNYSVSSSISALPILCDYDLTNTETEEKHLVYVVENNVATPVLITYVTVTDESGAVHCDAICRNLNNDMYIDYATINKVKEATNGSIY